jgi:preprotein translocase subunit YajC
MIGNLRRGDQVTLSGGVIGRITKVVDDNTIELEIAENVRIRAAKQFVSDLRSKGEPAEEK